MMMQYKVIVIMVLLMSFLASCTSNEQDNNGVLIPFSKAIGKYKGFSKICKNANGSLDTTCTKPEINTLRIILLDQSNIIIKDDIDAFAETTMFFKNSSIINGGKNYAFESVDTTKKIKLNFNENALSVVLTADKGTATNILSDIFEGKR